MSKDKETYQIISEKELLDYLEGKIKGTRANQIERQILNSSFEEEALEGFSAIETEDLRTDLSKLRNRLQARHTPKPGYLGIAATLAFLIAAFSSLWFVMNNALPYDQLSFERTIETKEEDNRNLALSEPDSAVEEVVTEELNPDLAAKPDSMQQLALTEPVDNDEDTVLAEEVNITADLDQIASLEVEDSIKEEDLITESIEIAALAEQEVDTFDDSAITNSEVVAVTQGAGAAKRQLAAESLSAPAKAAAPAEIREEASQSEIISGTVYYREDGEPLAGVKVTLNSATATTGLYGKFEIANVGNGEELVFTHPGTSPKRVGIEDTDAINVVMAPAASTLQEVSVIGYGHEDGSASIKSPVPKPGVQAFKEYVVSNLVYPEEARTQQVEGVVLVKLTVSSDGSINNVEIKKGISQACDQEARRVIRDGPQWNPALYNGEPIEGSVRIRIPFKITN